MPALAKESFVVIPRGLRVRVHLEDVLSFASVVRRVAADHLALDVDEIAEELRGHRGDPLTLTGRLHGRLYTFDVTLRGFEDRPPALLVSIPRSARSNERRTFYRLACNIPARAYWLDEDGEEVDLGPCRLLDVSGGGALLRSRSRMPVGAQLTLFFSVTPDAVPIAVPARASTVQAEERTSAYRINTEFAGIDRRTQDEIVRFIFRQQVLLSRRRAQ